MEKKQVMCLASSQRRTTMKSRGEDRKFRVNIEGKEITEMKTGTILGITWSTDLSWKDHLTEVAKSQGYSTGDLLSK